MSIQAKHNALQNRLFPLGNSKLYFIPISKFNNRDAYFLRQIGRGYLPGSKNWIKTEDCEDV